jgi:retron-type reverse transcriptase
LLRNGRNYLSFEKNLFRLQHRIYKANQDDDPNRVYRLQCLIIGSPCARYLAVRQVSQLNLGLGLGLGKKTAGVDGISSLSPKQRLELADELKNLKNWKHSDLKRKR